MSKYIYYKDEDENDKYWIFTSAIESNTESEWERTNSHITEFIICTEKDNDFPFCYDIENNKKVFKLDQAKEVTKNRLRTDRISLLNAQDVLFMRAQESGADTTAIVAEKKRLRDITKDADACTSAGQLKALSVEE